jgi:hypothetical protein
VFIIIHLKDGINVQRTKEKGESRKEKVGAKPPELRAREKVD